MPLKSAATPSSADHRETERLYRRDFEGLAAQLDDGDAGVRRWAARDLARLHHAVGALAGRLCKETAPEVPEAIFDALLAIGSEDAVDELLVLLRSEDAALRNGAVAVLQQLPQPVGGHMRALLNDADADVRILAIDVLQLLPHPEAPGWLSELLQRETHINVVGAAIDRLAEIGTADMLPVLAEVNQRFADEPYIQFAIDTVVRRISDGPKAA